MMWVKEFGELLDVLPYYLIVCLPIFIALSPVNPVEAAQELDVHRLAQFEISGNLHGSKQAALTMEARGPGASHVLRKIVVTKMKELSVPGFRELVSNGAGGLLLLIPSSLGDLGSTARETILQLEEELLSSEHEIPIYFAEETPELDDLYTTLAGEGEGSSAASSAFAALVAGISSSGYQLVVSASTPQPVKDQGVVSVSGQLKGAGGDDQPPTIVVVAHYDAAAGAPTLSNGADSNGSGVAILLELARLFSGLYSSSRSHPMGSIVFLLSGGGKINYAGTKRWLEEHLDMDTTSDVLSNVQFVLCLDSLGRNESIKLHVSKPPKEGSAGDLFYGHLQSSSAALYPEASPVQMVHKKINLADDSLSWEHERFSIRRLPAFTLSHHGGPRTQERASLLDTVDSVSSDVLQVNTRIIAEALACSLYPRLADTGCEGQVFAGSVTPTPDSLGGWLKLATAAPRHSSLLVGRQSETVRSLTAALSRYTHEVTTLTATPDRREPEFQLYDTPTAMMNVYRVKPAVFDLLLSALIGGYLSLFYLLLINSSTIVAFLANLGKEKELEANGNAVKQNGAAKNGHQKLHAY